MPRKKRQPIKCTECPMMFVPFSHKLTCSPACAAARLARQLQELNTKRRGDKEWRTCKSCSKLYKKGIDGGRNKYCGEECYLEGLRAAIERQKKRREANSKLKQAS